MKLRLLELFAGSRSWGKQAEKLGFEVFSTDIHNYPDIDLVKDIRDITPKDIPFIPTHIVASPPCTTFSVASIGHHWNIDNTPKTYEAILGVQIVQITINLIKHYLELDPGIKFYIENPRGKLRKLDVIKNVFPRATVWYCKYNDEYKRAKPTDIWSNNITNLFNPNGWSPKPVCYNNNFNCNHEKAIRSNKDKGTQGMNKDITRSSIPAELCKEILIS